LSSTVIVVAEFLPALLPLHIAGLVIVWIIKLEVIGFVDYVFQYLVIINKAITVMALLLGPPLGSPFGEKTRLASQLSGWLKAVSPSSTFQW
jgi:hypothetical protein